jgi:hypothetical protein
MCPSTGGSIDKEQSILERAHIKGGALREIMNTVVQTAMQALKSGHFAASRGNERAAIPKLNVLPFKRTGYYTYHLL